MFGYGRPRILVRAWERALPLGMPVREIAPEVETEYCAMLLPTSKVFAPESVTDSEIGELGWTAARRSAHRPPQPVTGGWSGTEVCHWVTWSAWEKSWGGFLEAPDWYCARVRGNTSVPALNSVASLPCVNRLASSGQAGCRP